MTDRPTPDRLNSDRPTPDRPHTTLVLALSIDGKIADRHQAPARFGSAEDKRRLEQAIATADAVLLGAGTLRAYHSSLAIHSPQLLAQRSAQQRPPQPIQILCSPSGNLDPTWRFFQQPFPRWLLTTPQGAVRWSSEPQFDRCLPLLAEIPESWSWPKLLGSLSQYLNQELGISQVSDTKSQILPRIAVLGGATLVTPLLEQGCIDELKLTLCPVLLGGETAPALLQGMGFPEALAPRLSLLNWEVVGDEIFLHYRVAP